MKRLATWNPDRQIWENSNGTVDLFSEHSEPYSETWPSSGSMRNGVAFELPTLEPHTVASVYSSWRTDAISPESTGGGALALLPSPTANLGSNGGPQDPDRRRAGGHAVSIEDVVSLLPTPLGSDGVHGGPNQRGGSGDLRISSVEQLFPTPRANLASSGQDTARADRDSTDGGDDLATAVELLPSPTVALADGGQTSRSGDRSGEPLLAGIVEHMLPTPSVSNKDGNQRNNRNQLLLPGVAETLLPSPTARDEKDGVSTPNVPENALLDLFAQVGEPSAPVDPTEDITADGEPVRWGKYRTAIMRAQRVAGRLAPSPTQPDGRGGRRRLAARFVEWMMLLPYGWVTGVPGLNRSEMLKMLGNGVVPPQASVAMLILLDQVDARLSERNAA